MNSLSHTISDKYRIDTSDKVRVNNRNEMYQHSNQADSDKGGLPNLARRFQEVVIGNFENFFYNYGKFVARYTTKKI